MTDSDTKIPVVEKCSICLEPIPEEENSHYKNNECGHFCCKVCLIEYLNMQINEKHKKIQCFSLGCNTYLSDSFIKSSLADYTSILERYTGNSNKNPIAPPPQVKKPIIVYIPNNRRRSKKCCECDWETGDCNRLDMFGSIINYLDETDDICRIVIANILVFLFGPLFLFYYNYFGAFGREGWRGCKMYFLNFFGIIMGFSYFIWYAFYWYLFNIIALPPILVISCVNKMRANLGCFMFLIWLTEDHDDD